MSSSDLGYGYESTKIYDGLQEAWNVPLGAGANVLALTIPECAAKSKRLDTRRDALNSFILGHRAAGL